MEGVDVGEKVRDGLAVREVLRVALRLCVGEEEPEPTPNPGVGVSIGVEERLERKWEGVGKVESEGCTVFDTNVATDVTETDGVFEGEAREVGEIEGVGV